MRKPKEQILVTCNCCGTHIQSPAEWSELCSVGTPTFDLCSKCRIALERTLPFVHREIATIPDYRFGRPEVHGRTMNLEQLLA